MVSSGYGDEGTVESIWATEWDTTQFDNINVVLGTQFNFWITEDGDTDIVDSAITSMLKQETHILFAFWKGMIKISAVTNPWDFINVWINDHLSGDDFFRRYETLIGKCKTILGNKKMEITSSHLPSSTINW